MLAGTDALFGTWLVFFRDQLSTVLSVGRAAAAHAVPELAAGAGADRAGLPVPCGHRLVVRKTEAAQRRVEGYNSALAGTAQDALSNVMVVQSFTRLQAELRMFGDIARELIRNQFPVLNWWALVNVMTRAVQHHRRDHHRAGRHVAAHARPGQPGRDRQLHGHRHAADRQAGDGRRVRVLAVLQAAGGRGLLRGAGCPQPGAGAGRRAQAVGAARRGAVRGRLLRLSRRLAGAERRVLHGAARHVGGAGRPYRRRQDHDDGAVAAPVGPDRGPDPDRRPEPAPRDAG